MGSSSLDAVVPMLCVILAALAVMGAEAFRGRGESLPLGGLGIVGLIGAAISSAFLWNRNALSFGVIVADNFGLFVTFVLVIVGILTIMFSSPVVERDGLPKGEYYTLILFSTAGMIMIASVVLGELVPKRLALLNPEAVASFAARPMRWVATVAYPVVKLLSIATDAILRVLGRRAVGSPPVTEEEIRVLMAQGTEAGVFEEHEHQLVSRVFRMDDLRTAAVMTPRTDVVYLNMEEPREAILRRIAELEAINFGVEEAPMAFKGEPMSTLGAWEQQLVAAV